MLIPEPVGERDRREPKNPPEMVEEGEEVVVERTVIVDVQQKVEEKVTDYKNPEGAKILTKKT